MAISGNTVRLKAEFKTFDDEYADPTGITLKIYTKTHAQYGDTVNIGAGDKTAVGIYEYDYTLPASGYDELTYEFSGTLEGTTILGRSTIDCDWT